MPTATPFAALGRGNGFNVCPNELIDFFGGQLVYYSSVNVNLYSVWTTLGGYNSNSTGTVTEEQINLSRQRAMKLCWNLHQVNCSLSAVSEGVTGRPYNESITNINTTREPRDRVFEFLPFAKRSDLGYCYIESYPIPIWLFKGDPSNWDNFIGFSVGDSNAYADKFDFIDSYALSDNANSEVKVVCAANGGTLTSLDGYPFVCSASGDVINEANFTASSDASGVTSPPESEPFTRTSSISITGLDFYTYP